MSSETQPEPPPAPRKTKGIALLLVKGAALAALVFIALIAVVTIIPDETDILDVASRKEARLAQLPSPRIVLIGGSNLAYGADSAMIERETSCPVVNMGLNGMLGIRYLLAQSEPNLREGDFVVLAFEYDTFFITPDGRADSMFGMAKADLHALSIMNWRQRFMVLQTLPRVAQSKLIRVMGETEALVLNTLFGAGTRPDYYPGSPEEDFVARIEQLSSFTPAGDITAHLGQTLPFETYDGLDLSALRSDPAIVDAIAAFIRTMEARNVHVLLSFTPTARDFYERHDGAIEAVTDRLAQLEPDHVQSAPTAFLYDRSAFFDTVYHLTAAPRSDRTSRLIADIVAQNGGISPCPGTGPERQSGT